MRKNILIRLDTHSIDVLTSGAEEFEKIVICFHGFTGNKCGDAYSGLEGRLSHSLVASFDSCGHGESEISSEDMRLDLILEEIDAVVTYLKKEYPNKPIILVAGSYGAYRVMQYLIKYRPNISKVIYINPAFRFLQTLERLREFKYCDLKENDKVVMKKSLNKFLKKDFLDDIYENDLYSRTFDLNYNVEIVVGEKDTLIPTADVLEIANRYNYPVTYVDDAHNFENKENWQKVVNMLEEAQ